MKAAVIYENGDPEVLRYEDVAEPDCPDACVVVDAEAISIEGGDLLARAEGHLPQKPHVIGYLSAGTVSEIGAGVTGVSVGDRVVSRNDAGSQRPADRLGRADVAAPSGRRRSKPPACRSPSARPTNASSPPANSPWTRPSSIHAGAGGVGMAAIQLAKHVGATVSRPLRATRSSNDCKALRTRPGASTMQPTTSSSGSTS